MNFMGENLKFNKQNLSTMLLTILEAIEKEYKFDRSNGYSQIEGKGEELSRKYGEYSAFRWVYEIINECQY